MRTLFFIFLFLSASVSHAQQLQFSNISTNMSLPSQECYNIMQDSKGYIWFSTEAGLCRYNGHSLKVFDKHNGLPEGSIYAAAEDRQGKLWFASSRNRILNYTSDSLNEAPFSKAYEDLLTGTLELTYLFSFTGQDSLYLNTGGKTVLVNTRTNGIAERHKPDTTAHFYLRRTSEGLIPINGGNMQRLSSSLKKATQGYVKILIQDGSKTREIRIPFQKTRYPYWRILTASAGEMRFLSFDNYVLRLNADLSYDIITYPDRVLQLYSDKDHGLWVGVRKNGVHYYPDASSLKDSIISLPAYSVTGICEDTEKGIWCTTLEKGVFYSRNKNIISYAGMNVLNKRAMLLKNVNGKIYSATNDNELVIISREGVVKKAMDNRMIYTLSDILKTDQGWLFTSPNRMFRTNGQFDFVTEVRTEGTPFSAGAYQFAGTGEGRIFAIQYSSLSEIIGNECIFRNEDAMSASGRCIFYEGKDRLLFGSKDGMYEMNIATYETKRIKGPVDEVVGIIRTKDGNVLVATRESGLYRLKDEMMEKINFHEKEKDIRLFDIICDKDGNLWLASSKGLIRSTAKEGRLASEIFTPRNGLLAREVYKVASDGERIYLSTNEGICAFALKADLSSNATPPLYIHSMSVNDQMIDHRKGSLAFDHDRNSLSIVFDVLTFKEPVVRLAYRFRNGKDSLRINEGNRLALSNMDPGMYELVVYPMNGDVPGKDPVTLKFEIRKPFWETGWFIIAAALVLMLLIYFVWQVMIRRVHRREEEKTKVNKLIAEYQLTALQAQMNPHFIFNAINSIQGYILKKNERQAYDYLAKFSKLIRMVLNQSTERTLTLKQELEMLSLYVELEQLRFDQSFDFKLSVDKDLRRFFGLQIPSMLVQPYVENAIWHGLMNLNKDRKGMLSVEFKLSNELLKITVEDNGVGRELSKTYKKETDHKSVGMILTEQRLMMINKLQDYEDAWVTITDLYDEKKSPAGTQVEIFIPVLS